ncbi:uncharacterized protein LOC142224678 [Haematobia irritans]|uniref:uncharacterized protein LOC142224678 n=1 Tax=Haematobia irritans TaxID=7368 RepID=UPI003F4FD8B3
MEMYLSDYRGNPIPTLGVTDVSIQYSNRLIDGLPLLVVEGNEANVIGWNWFQSLGNRIEGVNSVSDGSSINNVLKQYESLFAKELGCYKDPPISLPINRSIRLATVAEPLRRLLDNNVRWTWGEQEQTAFTALKNLITSDRVLIHFDEKLPLVVAADASPYGIGAVLKHRMPDGAERPIAFYSRTLSKSERNYAQIDRKATALIAAINKFHEYLHGRKFALITDHRPLLGIFRTTKPVLLVISNQMLQRCIFLSAYDFELIYRSANKMGNADFLSRFPVEDESKEAVEVMLIESTGSSPVDATQIAKETKRDKLLAKVLSWALRGWSTSLSRCDELNTFFLKRNEISTLKGCLLWRNGTIIPPSARQNILEALQDEGIGQELSLSDYIGSDNATAFTSEEFRQFLSNNCIPQIRVAPFHPSSNGQAERMVQTTKDFLKKMPIDSNTELNVIHPHEIGEEGNFPKTESFEHNDTVWTRNYSTGLKWIEGRIVSKNGPISYSVQVSDSQIVKRHLDQIRKRVDQIWEPNLKDGTSLENHVNSELFDTEPNDGNIEDNEPPEQENPTPNCSAQAQAPAPDVNTPRRSTRVKRPPSYYILSGR